MGIGNTIIDGVAGAAELADLTTDVSIAINPATKGSVEGEKARARVKDTTTKISQTAKKAYTYVTTEDPSAMVQTAKEKLTNYAENTFVKGDLNYTADFSGKAFGVAATGATLKAAKAAKAGAVVDAEAVSAAERTVFGDVLSTPKGKRPDPTSYLASEKIEAHLQRFEEVVTKFSATAPSGTVGPPGGTFVMPKSVADNLIGRSGGGVSQLEKFLSLEPGTLGTSPVRVDISSPSGLRMPSGNELGANSQWRPGGFTGGGIPEATIDPVKPGNYDVQNIF